MNHEFITRKNDKLEMTNLNDELDRTTLPVQVIANSPGQQLQRISADDETVRHSHISANQQAYQKKNRPMGYSRRRQQWNLSPRSRILSKSRDLSIKDFGTFIGNQFYSTIN